MYTQPRVEHCALTRNTTDSYAYRDDLLRAFCESSVNDTQWYRTQMLVPSRSNERTRNKAPGQFASQIIYERRTTWAARGVV